MSGNVVAVYPGGATFSTIQAAIDSITDASPEKEYQVEVGPGTYNEKVTLKEYVNLMGKDADMPPTSIITSDCTEVGPPTVTAASNCSLSSLQVIANGKQDLSTVTAILGKDVQRFQIVSCQVFGRNTATNGVSTVTVSIMGNSKAEIASCEVDNQVSGQTGSAQAVSAWSGTSLMIYNSKISGNGAGGNGAAVLADGNGTHVKVESGSSKCPDWALWLQDGGAMTAIDVDVVEGQVSPGVKVEN